MALFFFFLVMSSDAFDNNNTYYNINMQQYAPVQEFISISGHSRSHLLLVILDKQRIECHR